MYTAPSRPDDRRYKTVAQLLDTLPTHLIDLRKNEIRLVRTADLIDDVTIPKAPHADSVPPEILALFDYAILSHRWGPQEPNFKTAVKQGIPPHGQLNGPGVSKLMAFCRTVKTRGIPFAWSDTCCINKQSSAELQEAINSMFSWYSNAKLCIVYLGETTSVQDLDKDPWFFRGWTLQELLAPQNMKFYNKDWKPMVEADNDKHNERIVNALSTTTGISQESIEHFEPGTQNVREKMIWASKRSTTRIEDVAYCLLGIFGVTMPIIYGEKGHAFFRLQEEIMKKSSKKDIFDWNGEPSRENTMLASHPSCFLSYAERRYPRYTPYQIFKFYSTTLLCLYTYDTWVVVQDWLFSLLMGEMGNMGKIGHSLTNRGVRTKFQLQNVAQISLVRKGSQDDGYFTYDIKANAIKTIRIQTKTELEPGSAIRRAAHKAMRTVIPTGLSAYRIALLNGWPFFGFTGMHTKKCVALLLQKVSFTDPYHFVRIPTKDPMLIMRNRNKWLVPEIVFIE